MGMDFTPLDLAIFFISLVTVMLVGLIAGRKEETSQDYYLAGRSIRWWGVAGSIFGSNVSANHLVGMMGVGFTVGFAQSHFELGAIGGLMLLCYGFLPVYRKLKLFTLGDYLRQRYDERSAVLYTLILLMVMVGVQMVQGFYIGSRSLNVLLQGSPQVAAQVDADGNELVAEEIARPTIRFDYYAYGVLALALVAGGYTIFGGLKAVIWTDVIQSVLLLAAGIAVALLVLQQPQIGGWSGMRELDSLRDHKMRLYLPSNHPDLPWTGVLTGLMCLHFFYWGTNQFIVQRALGASSDRDATGDRRRGVFETADSILCHWRRHRCLLPLSSQIERRPDRFRRGIHRSREVGRTARCRFDGLDCRRADRCHSQFHRLDDELGSYARHLRYLSKAHQSQCQ